MTYCNGVRFFFFGCWNQRGSMRDQVLKKLQENRDKFQFGLIGGDNHYRSPETQEYVLEDFFDGFDILNKLMIPVYGVLGNHDDNNFLRKSLQLGSNHLFENIFIFDSRIIRFPSFSLVFINSNDFSFYKQKINYCLYYYKHLCSKIENEIKKTHLPLIFLVCHHPIFGFQRKVPKSTHSVSDTIEHEYWPNYEIFVENIFRVLKKYKVKLVVLSADIHNFQQIRFTKGDLYFDNYIAGTGGGVSNTIRHISEQILKIHLRNFSIEAVRIGDAFGYLDAFIGPDSKFVAKYRKVG